MQLRRAMEIVNTQDNNSNIFYKENPVKILSVDNNIGTAYVETLQGDFIEKTLGIKLFQVFFLSLEICNNEDKLENFSKILPKKINPI